MSAAAEQILTTVVCLTLFAIAAAAVLRRRMRVSRLHGLPYVPGERRGAAGHDARPREMDGGEDDSDDHGDGGDDGDGDGGDA